MRGSIEDVSPNPAALARWSRAPDMGYGAGDRHSTIRETAMIKPRRVGHATFETQDLEKQIAYWTDVAGLVLSEREKNRAFLATKTGLLVVALEKADRAHCT